MVSTSDPDSLAGALATFFNAGYAGVSLPVVGAGLALQHVSPRVTLLIFGLAVGLEILAAARALIRPIAVATGPAEPSSDPMTAMCCCFGAEIAVGNSEPVLSNVEIETSSGNATSSKSTGIPEMARSTDSQDVTGRQSPAFLRQGKGAAAGQPRMRESWQGTAVGRSRNSIACRSTDRYVANRISASWHLD